MTLDCCTTKMPTNCIAGLLQRAAESFPSGRLIIYEPEESKTDITYENFYAQALENAKLIQSRSGFDAGCPVLLRLDSHKDFLLWFWGIVLAGGVPVPMPPLSHVENQRRTVIQRLSTVFSRPLCITTNDMLPVLGDLGACTIESLHQQPVNRSAWQPRTNWHSSDLALLMLTSGSTGNPKVVCLDHRNIISAVAGKASVRTLPSNRPFLNWIGLDHVASLIEIHIQAMYLGVDQIHVPAGDIVASPLRFLDLLSDHRVCRSFAPNSFLASLVSTLNTLSKSKSWNLTNLTLLASGGEANDLRTCVAASEVFKRHGAPDNVITPGFGMTETCAGAIFNLDCPAYDIPNGNSFVSVGRCMTGIEMRVVGHQNTKSLVKVGYLEVKGDVVFKGYYSNRKATEEAFTPDGWFRTGDQATLDPSGNLHIIGRVADVMNINGIKYSCIELEKSLLQVLHTRIQRLVAFSFRPVHLHTENISVSYVPRNTALQDEEFIDIHNTILQTTVLSTGTVPQIFILETDSLLPTSSLGKISRVKMRKLLECNNFFEQVESYKHRLMTIRNQDNGQAMRPFEVLLVEDLTECLGFESSEFELNTPLIDLGITSMDLIRLKKRISERQGFDIPMILIIKNPTVRMLAAALKDASKSDTTAYNPVITLRSNGSKQPLWLVHPGVGEVLVFLGLSKEIDDRPVYSLRARGFDGEPRFTCISEIVTIYYQAIKQIQPHGPYAISGYSYGGMLAFEVSKKLESHGDEIGFLGIFNLPPHIKSRMQALTWNSCLLHLMYFLNLLTESTVDDMEEIVPLLPRHDAIMKLLQLADVKRMADLGLDERSLSDWANLAHGLQKMATTYEPSGSVRSIDVFHCIPLKMAAKSREDWLENHLSKWADFSRTAPRFHATGGSHYTMIGADHVVNFAGILGQALKNRDI
ncbi:hypothetical protein EIK77_004036 [Talaromyces pinophilus]|nr:hypothetical protein EIK77_004036 [Talaromyces pinophilus]